MRLIDAVGRLYVLGDGRGFADQAPSVWQRFLQSWEEYLIDSQGEDDI